MNDMEDIETATELTTAQIAREQMEYMLGRARERQTEACRDVESLEFDLSGAIRRAAQAARDVAAMEWAMSRITDEVSL